MAEWGFNKLEGDDLRLRIEIAPADNRGNLNVRFVVADYDEPDNRARGNFSTNYPDIDAFRAGIALLMGGQSNEATLDGR